MKTGSAGTPPASLEPLRNELERLISPANPESLWACEAVLARAIAGGAFTEFTNEIIATLVDEPTTMPPPMAPIFRQHGFRLEMLAIEEMLVKEDPSEIAAHADHMLLANLGPGPADIRLYEREHLDDIEVFDSSVRLVERGDRRLFPGEILRVRASAELFHITRVAGPTVFVVLFGPTVHQTVTVYSGDDLSAVRQYAAKLSITRAQTALTLLNELNATADDELTGAVVSMLDHPAHAVRWAAANTLSRFSAEWRDLALERLRDDPHPHVQDAVRRSMEGQVRGA